MLKYNIEKLIAVLAMILFLFAGPFLFAQDLVIEETNINTAENYDAESITIGPDVTIDSMGNVVLTTNTLAIKPQFFILAGGQLNVITESVAVSVENEQKIALPENFKVSQNYPNPFNPETVITYQIAKSSRVSLKIFDISGRLIETLVNHTQSAGEYSVIFNASNLPSGMYYYRINAGKFKITKKMTLIK